MTATPTPRRRVVVGGLLVVLIGLTPLLVLEWLQAEGTVGGLQRLWLWGGVAVVLLGCGLIAGWAIRRLDDNDLGNASDTGATLGAGMSVWLVLSLAAPLLVLVRNAGDETVGIAGAGPLMYAQWAAAVLLAAGLAVLAAAGAHRYLRRGAGAEGGSPRPDAPPDGRTASA